MTKHFTLSFFFLFAFTAFSQAEAGKCVTFKDTDGSNYIACFDCQTADITVKQVLNSSICYRFGFDKVIFTTKDEAAQLLAKNISPEQVPSLVVKFIREEMTFLNEKIDLFIEFLQDGGETKDIVIKNFKEELEILDFRSDTALFALPSEIEKKLRQNFEECIKYEISKLMIPLAINCATGWAKESLIKSIQDSFVRFDYLVVSTLNQYYDLNVPKWSVNS